MRIEHIALATENLEEMKEFYERYFDATSNEKYVNKEKGFESYFLAFSDGARIEIMRQKSTYKTKGDYTKLGYSHIAISIGSKDNVEKLTHRMQEDGVNVVSQPRMTGDGYYESVVHDPDGNRIEITI